MNASNNNTARKGLRGWWTSPPRSGLRLMIAPFEYRNLRPFGSLHVVAGTVLACLGLTVLSAGGNDAKTYLFTLLFVAGGVAHLAVGLWELSILRSNAAAAAPGRSGLADC